ncbi:MAG: hypothetical protein NVSMB32_17920 [Actinomycetota bacterium]
MDITATREMLVRCLRDARAMEESVLMLLDSMIATTKDPEILSALDHHRSETVVHERRLARRLMEMAVPVAGPVNIPAIFGLIAQEMIDTGRTDKPSRNARDAYIAQALQIAAYRLLEALALRAGDPETAGIARANCREEVAMRDLIDATWGRVVELTLLA